MVRQSAATTAATTLRGGRHLVRHWNLTSANDFDGSAAPVQLIELRAYGLHRMPTEAASP